MKQTVDYRVNAPSQSLIIIVKRSVLLPVRRDPRDKESLRPGMRLLSY